MSTAERFMPEREPAPQLQAIEGTSLGGEVLNVHDQYPEPFETIDRSQLTEDIITQLHKQPSYDLFTGIISGVSVRTGLINENRLDEFVLAAKDVYSNVLQHDLTKKMDNDLSDLLSDVQDEMLDANRASAEVLLDVVLLMNRQRNNGEAIYLNRFFLLTIAKLTSRI